jgi:hypothetical protein
MPNGFQNMSQQPSRPLVPGRLIAKRNPWRAPLTNRLVELIAMVCTYEVNGVIKTEEIGHEVCPPLDDGTVPASTAEIRECMRCLSLISACNAFTCRCGRTFCLGCRVVVVIEGHHVSLCRDCAEKEHGGIVYRVSQWLWG